MNQFFVSDAIFRERLAFTQPEAKNASGWKKLSSLYQASFAACGYRITQVIRPEIYQSETAHKVLGIEPGDCHLAVKPIEHLRPLHGIPNLFVCNWPFPELGDGPRGDSPFYDQVHLLGLADVVLCCTAFTTQILREAGIARAITLPPIIPAVPRQRADAAVPGSRRTEFISIVDDIYQLGPAIEGFTLAATQDPHLHLTICLADRNKDSIAELKRRIAESAANITANNSEQGLPAAPDFFLYADPAPGLSIALVGAMLARLPLVITMSAGTASFVSPHAAIPIATEPHVPAATEQPIARFLPLTASPATAEAVRDAVLTAAAQDPGSRIRMAEAAYQIAEHRFGPAAFKAGLGQIGNIISMQPA